MLPGQGLPCPVAVLTESRIAAASGEPGREEARSGLAHCTCASPAGSNSSIVLFCPALPCRTPAGWS